MNKKYTNQLINESSPYLLQHAHNPVNWMPWGDEALEKATKEDKLILISIGYSSCHWCHVMEHESFEDEEVAQLMNEHFICIKVDREERPDIDQVYMDAIQLLTGRGGWPLNCFALADGKPVYGGTYFKKADWKSLLKQLAQLNKNEKTRLLRQAKAIQEGVINQENAQVKDEKSAINKDLIVSGIHKMSEGFDTLQGGFNGAPKFPMPSILSYLLNFISKEYDIEIKKHVLNTLEKIALGGIYDHVGGGFARYSVDAAWFAPHFEKMLYDNAQLISVYSKAYSLTKNEHFKRVVYQSISFIQRELTTSEGAFYSALDADSEGEEGKFYVWKADELQYHLGNNYSLFAEYYTVREKGNWEFGNNILSARTTFENFSTEKSISLPDLQSQFDQANSVLLQEREERTRPGLDDKILTSWNALMIKGYIAAYHAFEDKSFLYAALLNARFIKEKMIKKDGLIMRSYKDGHSKINGFLDDYAFTISAFIDVYEATFEEEWLITAKQLNDSVLKNFYDEQSDFLFYKSKQDKPLAFPKKEIGDNVIPSSNSAMAENLFKLALFFGNTEYRNKADEMIASMAYEVNSYGRFYSNWGRIITDQIYPNKEIVVVGENARTVVDELRKKSNTNHLFAASKAESDIPIFRDRFTKGKTLIYVCENNTCNLPIEQVHEALKLLE